MDAVKLLNENLETPVKDRWMLPFPMGVFGTLRESQWNNRRMHAGKFFSHRRAFMPHFVAHGLSISFKQNSSAAFEIFTYEPKEWGKMIPGVDALEGFDPDWYGDEESFKNSFGYFRTLAWLHVLPENYDHQLYQPSRLPSIRDLEIDPKTWGEYPRVPCWVYSSTGQNKLAKGTDTIIWG